MRGECIGGGIVAVQPRKRGRVHARAAGCMHGAQRAKQRIGFAALQQGIARDGRERCHADPPRNQSAHAIG
jgi:hypothetical protein